MSELRHCDLVRIQNARERFWNTNGGKEPTDPELMIFLLDEIEQYREKIKEAEQLEKRRADEFTKMILGRDEFAKYTKETADFCETTKDAIFALNERVTQLCEQSTKLKTLSVEQTADGGVMTVTTTDEAWLTIAINLLANGYFVCVHVEKEEQTVTIEFWRA